MRALLGRAATAATSRPRTVILVWLIVVGVLAAFGLGVGSKLSTRAVFVDGSAAKRAHEIAVRQFGDQEAFIVVLHGPPAAVEAQGKQLTRRFQASSRATLISPWSGAKTISGLRPRPGVAALLVNVKPESGQGTIEVVEAVERTVAATVSPPVRANVAGGGVVLDSFHKAAEDAAATGEKIAIPILMVVLLIVFRSVLAALIPVIVGGAVVASTRGVMDLSLGFIHLESFALGPAGMIGLALGVDYTLLVVSRYREELARSDDVGAAVTETVISSGRAVIPAGCGLIAAMLVGTIVLPSPLLVSAAFAVIAVAILSMASAILVTPSVLVLLGKNLDRWSIAVRPESRGLVARWSERLSRRPIVLVPIIVTLLGLSIWAFALKSEAATAAFLPTDDPGRVQQEAIESRIGAGWVAPLEVVMDSGDRPVTTPRILHALARFQRRVEADPDVVAMAGLAPIERSTRQLDGIDSELATVPAPGLGKLKGGIGQARAGSETAEARVAEAAAGAGELGTATGEAAGGSSKLGEGIEAAGNGSSELAGGIERTGTGSKRLANGVTDAGAQSARLASGVAKAHRQSDQASNGSHLLENALRSGNEALGSVQGPLHTSEEQLGQALATLRELSAESGNPGYGKALGAVEAASESLTGRSASTGEPLGGGYEGAASGVEQGQNQFSLGMYLAHKIKKNGKQATVGLGKLQKGAEQLSAGIDRLSTASREMSLAIAKLQQGGEAIPPSLQRLAAGAERLTVGLHEIDAGTEGLEGGLGSGAEQLRGLAGALGGVESAVGEKQQEVEAETEEAEEESQQLTELKERSPRLFRSGYFYLASLDGSKPSKRRQAAFLINLDHGGHAARMLVVPRSASVSSGTEALRSHLGKEAERLGRETGTEVVVGGVSGIQAALNTYYRDESPYLRIALLLVSVVVLVLVLRSVTMPLIAALLNLITVAASFGILALVSNGSLIGGPGHVDSTVVPATIMVMFGLSIDYEIFLFARIREEYDRTGSTDQAVTNGIDHTAHVITGAAIIMIAVFVAFSFSSFVTIRDFGVAQVIAVFIDAFVIRLVVVPAVMRGLGERAWWVPRPFRGARRAEPDQG
jgi:putative drug exporter of the RND superfamily